MPGIEKKHEFKGNLQEVFEAITKYERYGDYLPGVTKVEVSKSPTPKAAVRVRYELQIIKTFYYVLDLFHNSPTEIHWNLVESNLMKENEGSWYFKEGRKKNTVQATYRLQVKFKGFVPSLVTDQVAAANLPKMFEGFQKLVDDCSKASTE